MVLSSKTMARNQLKKVLTEDPEEEIVEVKEPKEKSERPKNTRREKKENKLSLSKRIKNTFRFLHNERFQKISGLSLLLASVYMGIAFTSFLFTWEQDHDKVLSPFSALFATEVSVDNWLGKFGALLSHLFFHKWFGVSSFLIAGLAFLCGARILFGVALLPLGKSFRYSFFFLIWTSVTLAALFHDHSFSPGGGFGHSMNMQLNGLIGGLGTAMLIGFSMLTFLVVTFNISFDWFKPKEEEAVIAAETGTLEMEIVGNTFKDEVLVAENTTQPLELEITEEAKNEEVVAEEETEEEEEEEESKELVLSESGVQFIVETGEEKEEITEPVENKEELPFGEYDPTLDLSSYQYPTIDLLDEYGGKEVNVNTEELNANKDRILKTLGDYGIEIEKIKATIGPTVTLYEIIPKAGVRISKIKNLEDDIALSLSALGIRIIAPIPGKGTIGIEVPNQTPEMVPMRNILASEKFQNTNMDLPIALGKTIANETFITDLAKMPHLLMAGATGQGKSVGLNAILVSLLYKKHPSQIKFVLVDPKKVELTLFNKIERHFLAKLPDSAEAIITDTKKVINTLNSLCIEMDQRYDLLKEAQVRNLKEYNAKFIARKLNPNNGHKFLPYIVLVIDEFADLIMTAGKEVETPIARLAQLARAIGIHLIIATQRPSVNIITGTIKANFPARIAFRVTSKIDSRTILDSGGAEQLIGRGDMLLSTGNDLIRLQCAFVDTPEVDKITDFIGSQRSYPEAFKLPEYVGEEEGDSHEFDPNDKDALFNEAARIVVQHQQGSASLLQRRLKLGYNRAGRIVDQLEAAGIIGPFEGSKAREVLIKDALSLEQFLNNIEKQA